jgi:uncharacterized protein (DUF433 family)
MTWVHESSGRRGCVVRSEVGLRARLPSRMPADIFTWLDEGFAEGGSNGLYRRRTLHDFRNRCDFQSGRSGAGKPLTKRAVDGVVDKRLLPSAVGTRCGRERVLTRMGVKITGAELLLRRELPVLQARKRIYEELVHREDLVAPIAVGATVRVDLRQPMREISEALARYRHLMQLIEIDDNVQRGEPVLRGTRVTAYTIAELMEHGTSVEDILRHYPMLDAEQIEAARCFAEAHPRGGRPVLPAGGEVVARMPVDTLRAL